jgi:hypothetical protein
MKSDEFNNPKDSPDPLRPFHPIFQVTFYVVVGLGISVSIWNLYQKNLQNYRGGQPNTADI